MSKHRGLPLHTLKQTPNKDLLTVLNRIRHVISYVDAHTSISTIVQETEEKADENDIYTSPKLIYYSFMQCAVDNLDFHENTTDGATIMLQEVMQQFNTGKI